MNLPVHEALPIRRTRAGEVRDFRLCTLTFTVPILFNLGCKIAGHPPTIQPDFRMIALFLGVLALIVLAILGTMHQQRRRARKVQEWARRNGFQWEAKGKVAPEISSFFVFRQFHRQRKIRNVLRGKRDRAKVCLFDYTISSGGRDAPVVTFTHTIASFQVSRAHLPDFLLSPAVTHWVPGKLGFALFGQVGFDSHPEFSRRYSLSTRDRSSEATVGGLFTPELLGFLEAFDTGHNWVVEGEGEWLVVYRWREEVAACDYSEFYDRAAAFADAFCRATHGQREES